MHAEIIVCISVSNSQVISLDGCGQGRIWKWIDAKDQPSRHGPWTLPAESKSATWLILNQDKEPEENHDKLNVEWMTYADGQTIKGCGLTNRDWIMIEYVVLNKFGDFVWSWEATTKAGLAKQLQDKDQKLQLILQHRQKWQASKNAPKLVGMKVDAMDASGWWVDGLMGWWYLVEVLKVEKAWVDKNVDEDSEK